MKTINILLLFITLFVSACSTASSRLLLTATPAATRPSNGTAPKATPASNGPALAGPATPRATASLMPQVTPIAGGRATLGVVGDRPQTLNPINEPHPALREITPLLFNALFRANPQDGRLQPGLAQSWQFSDDGRQVRITLPPDLKWSDGTPMLAADVAASLEATLHPALTAFEQIRAVDGQTLELIFAAIDCGALTSLVLLPLLPAGQTVAALPTGSGPFMVSNWSDDDQTLALRRNPHYSLGTGPLLDSLTVRFIPAGELDIVLSEGAEQFDLIGPLQGLVPSLPQDFTDLIYPAPEVLFLALNRQPRDEPPLGPAVHQALIYAVDRNALLEELLGDDGQLLSGSLLPQHWAANDLLEPPPFQPDQARALLTSAGFRDSDGDGWIDDQGRRLELAIQVNGQDTLSQQTAWLLSSYYRAVGLFSRAEYFPPDGLITNLFRHSFQLALFSWPALPDPDQRIFWQSDENIEGVGLNFTSYSNPEVDALLDQAVAIPGCDLEAQAATYAEVQQILSEERPADFLFAPNHHIFVNSRLHGVAPGPFAPLTSDADNWYLVEE